VRVLVDTTTLPATRPGVSVQFRNFSGPCAFVQPLSFGAVACSIPSVQADRLRAIEQGQTLGSDVAGLEVEHVPFVGAIDRRCEI
jgi:hypothetical protein